MPSRTFLEKPPRWRQAEFVALVQKSRAYNRPWVQPPDSENAFAAYLKRCRGKAFRGFFVCIADDNALAGVVNVSQIVHGNLHGAYLGYYGFRATSGQGYMTEGLAQVIDVGFGEMKLHRLEANIQPNNKDFHRTRRAAWFSTRGGLAEIPQDSRTLARPRTLGDTCGELANASASS